MKVGLSQARFAHRFGFPVGTLRHWEQGTRKPRGCALALLHVIACNAAVATRAILRARSGATGAGALPYHRALPSTSRPLVARRADISRPDPSTRMNALDVALANGQDAVAAVLREAGAQAGK